MNCIVALALVVIKELYRRKDFYVLFVLTALITILSGSVNFFGDASIIRYVKELCLLLIWISMLVIAITTTARQIPVERENRTLFPLLAKPVSRSQLIVGKFFGCWLAGGLSLLVFYLFFGVLTAMREPQFALDGYLQALWLHWLFLAIVTAMCLLGSLVFAAPSSNATICFVLVAGILLLGRHLNKVALGFSEPLRSITYGVYFAIPHLEFFDVRDLVIHNWGAAPWWVCVLATLYAAAYSGFFLLAACLIFRRKAVV